MKRILFVIGIWVGYVLLYSALMFIGISLHTDETQLNGIWFVMCAYLYYYEMLKPRGQPWYKALVILIPLLNLYFLGRMFWAWTLGRGAIDQVTGGRPSAPVSSGGTYP